AFSRSGNIFGAIDFPPQAVVHSQLRGHSPAILTIEEQAVLHFARIVDALDIARETSDVADHIGRETAAATCGPLRLRSAEIKNAGRVVVARDTQIVGVAHIRAELDGVFADRLRPVVSELILMLTLQKRAVAVVGTKPKAERGTQSAEGRHAAGGWS